MVKFYSPGCPHCQTLVGPWSKAAAELDGHVQFMAVNCRTDNALCQRFRVSGVPTIKMFTQSDDGKQRLVLDYEGPRTKAAISDYATSRVPLMVWRVTVSGAGKNREIDLAGFLSKGAALPHALLLKPGLTKPKMPLKTIANRLYRRLVVGMLDSSDPKLAKELEQLGVKAGEEALLYLPKADSIERYEGAMAFTPMLGYLEGKLTGSGDKDEL